jgi:hypothetical protein
MTLQGDFEITIFNAPLYSNYSFDNNETRQLENLLYGEMTIDCPCIHCGKDSTFRSYSRINSSNTMLADDKLLKIIRNRKYFERVLQCSRQDEHYIVFYFIVEENEIIKVGQYPSIADLTLGTIKKYNKILTKEKFKELSKAIGLSAHGIGIGSFVYLRRIFEDLIEEAHTKAIQLSGWDEEQYNKGRVDEKILMVQQYLPAFLVKNRLMYGILSKGIHELNEEECIDMFPVIETGIELILDEKLAEREQQKKIKEAAAALQKITEGLKK